MSVVGVCTLRGVVLPMKARYISEWPVQRAVDSLKSRIRSEW